MRAVKSKQKVFINVVTKISLLAHHYFCTQNEYILLSLEEVINENLQALIIAVFIFHVHFKRGEGDLKIANFVPLLAVLQ